MNERRIVNVIILVVVVEQGNIILAIVIMKKNTQWIGSIRSKSFLSDLSVSMKNERQRQIGDEMNEERTNIRYGQEQTVHI
jgi:hypothetical protein